jgi:hypothetical protein
MDYEDYYENYKTGDWLEIQREYFRQNDLTEIIKDQKKLEKDLMISNEAGNMKEADISIKKLTLLCCLIDIMLGDYKNIFELFVSTAKLYKCPWTISDCFWAYCWVSDYLVSYVLDNEDLTKSISHDEIVYTYDVERKKLNGIFEEFIKEFTADTETLKKFPETADKKDRAALGELARQSLIARELSPENKYKLSRPVFCKEVVRELLKRDYNKNSGFIFMQHFIEHHVDPATIQNYFRVCKKDMPIK